MRLFTLLMLISCLAVTQSGCGSSRMADMKRNAIKRPSEDDDDDTPSPAPPKNKKRQKPDDEEKDKRPATAKSTVVKKDGGTQEPIVDVTDNYPEAPDLESKPAQPLSLLQRRERTLTQMKLIADALQHYVLQNGRYPTPATYAGGGDRELLSWRVELLPYLGYAELYEKFHLDEQWDSPHNKTLLAEIPPVYQSPERFDDKTNYLVPSMPSSLFRGGRGLVPRKVEDGVANTIMLLEVDDEAAVPWTKPQDFKFRKSLRESRLGGLREDGIFVAWGTGKVGRIKATTPANKLVAALSADGGEAFTYPEINFTATARMEQTLAVADSPGTDDPETNDPRSEGGQDTDVVAPVTWGPADELSDHGDAALGQGNEREAFAFYFASLLAESNRSKTGRAWQWYGGLKRPAIGLRWGVGVTYIAPRNFDKTPAPIGVEGSGAGRNTSKEPSEKQLLFYTAELGQRLLDLAQEHIEEGKCGPIYAKLTEPIINVKEPKPSQRRKPVLISKGVTALGTGSRTVLVHLAEKEAVDVLVIFDMNVKQTRTEAVNNSTTVRVVDMGSRQTIYSSRTLNNLQVAAARDDPLKEDPVDKEFERLIEFVEQNLTATALPEIKPEHARRRVEHLTQSRKQYPLPVLAEIRLYHELGLISERELDDAYQAILGPDLGHELYLAAPIDVAKRLTKWLPETE